MSPPVSPTPGSNTGNVTARASSPWPQRKVTMGAIAAAGITIVLAVIDASQKKPLPPGLGEAITTLVYFVASYLTRPSPADTIVLERKETSG